MLNIFKRKYSAPNIKIIKDDIPNWLSTNHHQFDIIYSNATFHWFGTHICLLSILKNCHKNLFSNGFLALRFSLKDNARELKKFLEIKLIEFLGHKESTYLYYSALDYNISIDQLLECGFHIHESEELKFEPFNDRDMDLQFLLNSQPIHEYFLDAAFNEFKKYLQDCWQKEKVKLQSHHIVVIASKKS